MLSAADHYAARVDAVLAQRSRLSGSPPDGDQFDGIPLDHPLISTDPHRPMDDNLQAICAYVEPDDVVIDVGGGGGRVSLPVAMKCREVVNVEPSPVMCRGFEANAQHAGISNVQAIIGQWPPANPAVGTFALVNHVVYLTPDIVPFVRALEKAGPRRVLMTVAEPPPPAWHRVLYELVYGEPEEVVPGLVELVNVLWELDILPDVHVLGPLREPPKVSAPDREQVMRQASEKFRDQWAFWPLGAQVESRLAEILDKNFDELFRESEEGIEASWICLGPEVLITWQPQGKS